MEESRGFEAVWYPPTHDPGVEPLFLVKSLILRGVQNIKARQKAYDRGHQPERFGRKSPRGGNPGPDRGHPQGQAQEQMGSPGETLGMGIKKEDDQGRQ